MSEQLPSFQLTLFGRLSGAVDRWLSNFGFLFLRPFIRELPKLPTLDSETDFLFRYLLRLAGIVALGFYCTTVAFFAERLFKWQITPYQESAFGIFAAGCVAFLFLIGALMKYALRVRSPLRSEAESSTVAENAYAQAAAIEREKRRLQSVYEQNLGDVFLLQSLEWKGIEVFDDGSYKFAPRVNVLLGKNGYGKTLILRSLAAMIQRDRERSGKLFQADADAWPEAQWVLTVTRNGDTERVVRDRIYFKDSVGTIPLLAIPDSRFVNRSLKAIAASPTGTEPLVYTGARHFLTQEPYEPVVLELLSQLCLAYLKKRTKRFDLPIFRLIENVVRQLTDDEEFRFDTIRETGRIGFEILVRTEGSHNAGLPIQSASQGTLSILAIFGLIYSFLGSLRNSRETNVLARAGIVLIDEIDAHLHPSWQQRIMGLLTSTFPNVQFIVSAHSPLIVAGCAWGEISVLRRSPESSNFNVDTLPEDFLGATSRDLYRRVFEISDIDRLYLEYATKATMADDEAGDRELERLSTSRRRSAADEERLNHLLREKQLIERAAEVRGDRLRSEQKEAYITMLKSEVERLQSKVVEQQSELQRLLPVPQAKSQGV